MRGLYGYGRAVQHVSEDLVRSNAVKSLDMRQIESLAAVVRSAIKCWTAAKRGIKPL
jgi:hypothetical protein